MTVGPVGSATTDCWETADRVALRCVAVFDVTHDMKSFVFEPPTVPGTSPPAFTFEPGQFITLHVEVDGAPISRCYTISSPPTRPHRLAITVKRVPDGPVSNWLHDTVVPGSILTVAAPGGAFTLTPAATSKYLFLSAGSGVTPLISMTRTLHDLASDADIAYVHSARTPIDIPFRAEMAALAMQIPGLSVSYVCEDDSVSEAWFGPRGRLNADLLMALVPDLHQRAVYICGPSPYMGAARGFLGELGYDMAGYHEESFVFPGPTAARSEQADTMAESARGAPEDPSGFAIEFTTSGRTFVCGPSQTILEAALDVGLRVASACGQGMCGTCKSTLVSGEVEMNHNGGIRPREIREGKILLCCSTPKGDLQIEC